MVPVLRQGRIGPAQIRHLDPPLWIQRIARRAAIHPSSRSIIRRFNQDFKTRNKRAQICISEVSMQRGRSSSNWNGHRQRSKSQRTESLKRDLMTIASHPTHHRGWSALRISITRLMTSTKQWTGWRDPLMIVQICKRPIRTLRVHQALDQKTTWATIWCTADLNTKWAATRRWLAVL